MDNIINKINYLFNQTKAVRFLFYIISSVFIGYTLQPVPLWLNEQFNTNSILKYVILVVAGMYLTLPITAEKLMYILVVSFGILQLFKYFRTLDKKEETTQ